MNTLMWNNILRKRGYPITTFVYTSSRDIKTAAQKEECVIRSIKRRNKFGLPILSLILQDLKSNSNTSYIAYINSDILLNPNTFSLLHYVDSCRRSKRIKFPVLHIILVDILD